MSLLNIVNNISDIDIGEHLQRFKDFTKDFTPALRGDQIGNFQFVKQIHNSFARSEMQFAATILRSFKIVLTMNRKMDMFCIDLGMENKFDDRRKTRSRQTEDQPSEKRKRTRVPDDEDDDDDEAAFHFIAFVPIDGEVWKLDGLNRQPERIGMSR